MKPTLFHIVPGWSYVVRLYQPRKEILDDAWSFPTISPTN